MEEPVVKATIMVPTGVCRKYYGLCQDRRGLYKDMKYIDEGRAILHYEIPLNEIIYDFFDALKIKDKGICIFRL